MNGGSTFNGFQGESMSIFDRFKNPALLELVKDQRLKELITRREFRLTEEYLHREILSKAVDDELTELTLKLGAGFAELTGRVKKRLVPFAIPFSARFSLHSIDFTRRGKVVHLRLEELKPLDLDWLTRKLVQNIPFVSYGDGLVTLDLSRVPRLAEFYGYQVKGVRPSDFVVLKELLFCEGELIGRVGLIL